MGFRLFEVPLSQQIKGLHDDLYDVGFAQSDEVGDGLLADPAWCDPLVVAVPAEHPLATRKSIPLDEVLFYPLVVCDPQVCEGQSRQIARLLRAEDREPLVVEQVATVDLMKALVAAGFALGLTGASQLAGSREHGIVACPLGGESLVLTTYLLRVDASPSETLARFIELVSGLEPQDDG